MRYFISCLLSPIYFVLFFVLLCIFHPIQWISYNLFGKKAHKTSVDILNFFIVHSWWIMGNRFRFRFVEKPPVGHPIIFAANHQSTWDIPSMILYLREYSVKFVSKMELGKGIPSISYNLQKGESALIDRKNPKQAIAEIARLGKLMHETNCSVVIFPEGTRTRDGSIKRFSSGGIAALLKKCPNAIVVPVAIENSWKLVRHGKFPLNVGITVTWTVLPAIYPKDKNYDEIANQAQEAIRVQLGLDKLTAELVVE